MPGIHVHANQNGDGAFRRVDVEPYDALKLRSIICHRGADYLLQRHAADAYRNRLVCRPQRMGFGVTLMPVDA